MSYDGDLSATADASGGRKYHGRATAWVFLATVSVLVLLTFELVLYVTALMLFSHVDTPDCASTNSFCSPDGHSGLTGGAIFLVAGNFITAAIAAALLGGRRQQTRAHETSATVSEAGIWDAQLFTPGKRCRELPLLLPGPLRGTGVARPPSSRSSIWSGRERARP